jgi:hypothetical protein
MLLMTIKLEQDEQMVFDIFFAGCVSMAHCHPAAGRSNGYGTAEKLTVEQCAELALEMVAVRRKVFAQ